MAESFEGELIMGHALPKRDTGRLFHMASTKEPNTTWHHDWRGNLYVNSLRLTAAGCVGLVLWSVYHFIR